jgi:hypothetical protein
MPQFGAGSAALWRVVGAALRQVNRSERPGDALLREVGHARAQAEPF